MDILNFNSASLILIGLLVGRLLHVRLRLSRAKHPSLRGHAKLSRRIARILSYFEYGPDRFYSSDNAPDRIASMRKLGLANLENEIRLESPRTFELLDSLEDTVSDLRFTAAYRVPFPYRNHLPRNLRLGTIAAGTEGTQLQDYDGNWRYDLSGSYGVNVFGYDFYKECIQEGAERVKDLGPVLGPYHPLIKSNVEKLKTISGLDEVSFHMSGTEAVMQAVRLARYHTGRTHLVRFCGAYHGWWDGVQPGIGNRRSIDDVYTLADISEKTLKVLETRNDIACVLINPMQAMHPNSDAPGDATLINSERSIRFDRRHYTDWLRSVRDVCSRRKIVLIFDEVFTGFRLGYRGAQEYFGIQADMVTYGKTLGGGYPVGAVCGRHNLMKRFRDNAPADVSFARGTFNSHPYVMGAMSVFLERITCPDIQQLLANAESVWAARVEHLNSRLCAEKLPVRVANMHSVLSVQYRVPSRYNWMLQFYLRAAGLELSWTGTGRMIMSLAFTDYEFKAVTERFVEAARRMRADGWWWHGPELTNKAIKRMMLIDMLKSRFPWASSPPSEFGNELPGDVTNARRPS